MQVGGTTCVFLEEWGLLGLSGSAIPRSFIIARVLCFGLIVYSTPPGITFVIALLMTFHL